MTELEAIDIYAPQIHTSAYQTKAVAGSLRNAEK